MIHVLLTIFLCCNSEDPILSRASTAKSTKNSAQDKSNGIEKIETKKQTPEKKLLEKSSQPQKDRPKKNPEPQASKIINKVTFSGVLSVQDWSGKQIRIDIFDGDQRSLDGPRPSVVHVEHLKETGSFSFKIPETEKSLWVGAYVDEDGDGKPGEGDPFGWYKKNPISGSKNYEDLNIKLQLPEEP